MRPLIVTEADFANLSLLNAPALRRRLANARRVWSDAMSPDVVTMNSRVVCTDVASGQRRILSVVYPDDADPSAGRMSVVTEAGMTLLGASPQQLIEWRRADGSLERIRVEAIAYQPEQDLRNKLIFPPGPAA